MTIPSIEDVISRLQDHFQIRLEKVPGKQVVYQGKNQDGKSFLVCSPQSRLHERKHGWIDLTTIQFDLLSQSDVPFLALRVEGNGVYYFYFNELKPYLTKQAMLYNQREGDHWKLYIWPETIEVRGNDSRLRVKPDTLPAQ